MNTFSLLGFTFFFFFWRETLKKKAKQNKTAGKKSYLCLVQLSSNIRIPFTFSIVSFKGVAAV